jgi:hypothetical protein
MIRNFFIPFFIVFCFTHYTYCQNKISLEIGCGINILKFKTDRDNLELDQLHYLQSGDGLIGRIIAKYELSKFFDIKSGLNYNNCSYSYILKDLVMPDEPLLFDHGTITSDFKEQSIGVLIGYELKFFKYLSFSNNYIYNSYFYNNIKSEIIFDDYQTNTHKDEKIEKGDFLKKGLSTSFEVSLKYKRFGITPGIEYFFDKELMYPTANKVSKYKYYFTINYLIK